jgi:hypothetical protein
MIIATLTLYAAKQYKLTDILCDLLLAQNHSHKGKSVRARFTIAGKVTATEKVFPEETGIGATIA